MIPFGFDYYKPNTLAKTVSLCIQLDSLKNPLSTMDGCVF